jgi:hypothetical protein
MGARRASVTALVAVAGSVLAVSSIVTWAASIGPGGVLTGDGPPTHRVTTVPASTDAVPSGAQTPANHQGGRQDPPDSHRVLEGLAVAVEILIACALAYLLYRLLRWSVERYRARRRPHAPPPVEIEFDVLEGPRRVVEEVVRDAEPQREALLGGTPRNGIVECWHRFEQQGDRAGLPRRPWETSSEFAMRMLDLVLPGSPDVARFAALYREARFSEHSLDERARAEALAVLDAIHAGLPTAVRGTT